MGGLMPLIHFDLIQSVLIHAGRQEMGTIQGDRGTLICPIKASKQVVSAVIDRSVSDGNNL